MKEINKLRQMYIDRYIALYEEDDYKKGNRIEKNFTKLEEKLIVDPEERKKMATLLDDDDYRVRYYSACTLISLFPDKCTKILKDTMKNGKYLAVDAKYALLNYKEGNNYFYNYLNSYEKTNNKC